MAVERKIKELQNVNFLFLIFIFFFFHLPRAKHDRSLIFFRNPERVWRGSFVYFSFVRCISFVINVAYGLRRSPTIIVLRVAAHDHQSPSCESWHTSYARIASVRRKLLPPLRVLKLKCSCFHDTHYRVVAYPLETTWPWSHVTWVRCNVVTSMWYPTMAIPLE